MAERAVKGGRRKRRQRHPGLMAIAAIVILALGAYALFFRDGGKSTPPGPRPGAGRSGPATTAPLTGGGTEPSPLAVRLDVPNDVIKLNFGKPPKSAVLFDLDTGRVLWRRNPTTVLPIASLTKMMTALVVADRIPPKGTVQVTKQALAYQGSGVGVLPKGKWIKVNTMLHGLLLPSGNDAAIALAQRAAGGSVKRFVGLMNAKAKALGLKCTRFSSPSGFVDKGNHSCAADLAAIARAVLREPRLARVVGRREAVLPFPIKGGKIYLYNNNPLLRARYPGTTGVKTGYTDAAGRCLVATVRRGPIKLGVVLLNSPDPGKQAMQLLRSRLPRLRRRPDRVEPAAMAPSRLSSPPAGRAARARGARRRDRLHAHPRWRRARPRRSAAAKATPTATPTAPQLAQLPRGGRRILPDFRVVAYYGAPQDQQLGALGIGTPASAARKLAQQAKGYARKSRPVLPAMELLAVVAASSPGEGGRYNLRQPDSVIRRYLDAARKAKALLILDIQPGRSDFFTETKRLRKWLKEPDVGLALDPEWRMDPGQIPGKVIGHVSAPEVNATTSWLNDLTQQYKLPQKLLLIHEFTDDMVPEQQLKPRSDLAYVLNVDGFGTQSLKVAKYKGFMAQTAQLPPRLQALLPRGHQHDDAGRGDGAAAAAGRRGVRMNGCVAAGTSRTGSTPSMSASASGSPSSPPRRSATQIAAGGPRGARRGPRRHRRRGRARRAAGDPQHGRERAQRAAPPAHLRRRRVTRA